MATISDGTQQGLSPRQFRSLEDFEAMKAILVVGRQMQTNHYYVHTGDLCWWLYYVDSQEDVWSHICLWEDSSGAVAGWTLFSPQFRTFDVFMKPELYSSSAAACAFEWSASRNEEIVRKEGGKAIRMMWISEIDAQTQGILQNLGFEMAGNTFLVMERSLSQSLPKVAAVPGFRLREGAGESDSITRATVSYATFGSHLPFAVYHQRYLQFMRSPVYDPNFDMVAESWQGRLAAFCICWLDAENRLGHFEPIGVHPDYRRKGLGKAIVLHGLQQLKDYGMERAMVCVDEENLAAISLYRLAGFECVDRLLTFERGI